MSVLFPADFQVDNSRNFQFFEFFAFQSSQHCSLEIKKNILLLAKSVYNQHFVWYSM